MVGMWGEKSRQRRRRRELERRLAELDRLDAVHGLGSWPASLPHEFPPPKPPRRRTFNLGPALFVILTIFVLVGSVVSFHPAPEAGAIRSMLGFDERPLRFGQSDDDYSFLLKQPSTGGPVTWSSCKEIHVQVNPTGAPDNWQELVDGAMSAITEASGLRFAYDGITDERDFGDRGGSSSSSFEPVLVGWATEAEVPALAGDVAGIGGPLAVTSQGRRMFVTGQVVLDIDTYERLEHTPYGEKGQLGIITHEFGHLVGLGHVDNPRELMFEDNVGHSTFGPGDRAGLAILGRGPC